MRIKNKPEDTTLENQNALQYKDHSEFFEEYYLLRKNFNRDFASSYFDNKLLKSCYLHLIQLLFWSYSQTEKVNKNVQEYETTLNEIMKLIKTQEYGKARSKMRVLFIDLAKNHSEAELIPKVDIKVEDEQEKFWKEENNLAMREMKKAFYDVLIAK